MKLIFQTRQAVDIANHQIALDMGCDENTPYWFDVTEEVDGSYSIPCPRNPQTCSLQPKIQARHIALNQSYM